VHPCAIRVLTNSLMSWIFFLGRKLALIFKEYRLFLPAWPL
jgi:hypothetical protein